MRTGASAELPASLRGGGLGLADVAAGIGGLVAAGFASALGAGGIAAMGLDASANAGCFSAGAFCAAAAPDGFPTAGLSAVTGAGSFSVDGLGASLAVAGFWGGGVLALAEAGARFSESEADPPTDALGAGALALAAGRVAGLALDAAAWTDFLPAAGAAFPETGRALAGARLVLADFGCALPPALRRVGAGVAAEPARAGGRLAAGLAPALAFGRGTATRLVAVACLAGAATFLGLAAGLTGRLGAGVRFPVLLAGVDAFMPATSPSSTGRELG